MLALVAQPVRAVASRRLAVRLFELSTLAGIVVALVAAVVRIH